MTKIADTLATPAGSVSWVGAYLDLLGFGAYGSTKEQGRRDLA
jgi:hypothetical protein